MNYFERFEIPVSPWIDVKAITQKFMELQRRYHPDFHAGADEQEREEMLRISSELNKAYAIFKQKDATLLYYLKTIGAWDEEQKETLSNTFLMEMMELNEELDEQGADWGKRVILEKIEEQDEIIRHLIGKTTAEMTEKDFKALISYLNHKKYLNRILDRLLN